MMGHTWGHAGQVGEWFGVLDIPEALRQRPLAAIDYVIEKFIPILIGFHRPRRMRISWKEYGEDGEEVAVHEFEEVVVADWGTLQKTIRNMGINSSNKVAVISLFIDLDTQIIDIEGESWADDSARFQISMTPPESEPESAGIGYAVYIDIWLSTTYGEHYVPRSNRDAAAQNRPRLEAFLQPFANILGETFRVGQSQLYYFAITETGFRDADILPPRGRG
jgi:hypothetical protein